MNPWIKRLKAKHFLEPDREVRVVLPRTFLDKAVELAIEGQKKRGGDSRLNEQKFLNIPGYEIDFISYCGHKAFADYMGIEYDMTLPGKGKHASFDIDGIVYNVKTKLPFRSGSIIGIRLSKHRLRKIAVDRFVSVMKWSEEVYLIQGWISTRDFKARCLYESHSTGETLAYCYKEDLFPVNLLKFEQEDKCLLQHLL